MNDTNALATSIRQRLTNRSKQRGEELQLLMLRYANDRLLYRLSISPYRDRFVLKGATLFSIWSQELHRVTRDVDLLGTGQVDEAFLREVFEAVLSLHAEDGLVFDTTSVEVEPIRKGQTYGGLRVTLRAKLTTARLNIQVDIGLGDAHVGQSTELPPLLDGPPATLRAYDKDTVVAEKLEAAVSLGTANSRMKDFYDIATLANEYSFMERSLAAALSTTFERRDTALPSEGLSTLFTRLRAEPNKAIHWKAFMKKAAPRNNWSLEETLDRVIAFAEEPLLATARADRSTRFWPPGGPWREKAAPE
jgi:predicted nucleotidyltransferase component of viral defense system